MSSQRMWIAAWVLVVPVLLFLAIFFLRLGYFIPILLPLGGFITARLTRKHRVSSPVKHSAAWVVGAYFVATLLVWWVANSHREESVVVRWHLDKPWGGTTPEVRLDLGGGHFLGSRSADLRAFLETREANTVAITYSANFTLGCFQSMGPVTVEGLGSAISPSYGVRGGGPGPWARYWWCR